MRPEDFSANAPSQVIQAEWEGRAYWAFVPSPLPQRVAVDWEMANLVAEATGALREQKKGLMQRLLTGHSAAQAEELLRSAAPSAPMTDTEEGEEPT